VEAIWPATVSPDWYQPQGKNFIRLDPEREHAYIAVTTSLAAANVGTIYRGKLYVSLALSNQISALAPNGTELTRYQSAPGDAVPLDSPAGIAFDSRTKSLLIVNHAIFTANPAHFAVLRLFVGNPGNPLDKPILP
jgi:DNA-binding beta-propeller fold protein YncE